MLEEDLIALLLADAGLAALIAARAWWDVRPQGSARPCIVLTMVSGVPDYAMSGATGLVSTIVQADCQGGTKASALDVSRALKQLLGGYRGSFGATVFGGAFVRDERQSFGKPDEAAESVSLVQLDFSLWHRPA